MDTESQPAEAPAARSVDETIAAIGRLHDQHRQDATAVQRGVDAVTRFVGRPRFALLVAVLGLAWIAANLAIARTGHVPLDHWPFSGLSGAAGILALFMTIFILITERRENELSELREQLTLELSMLGEQKSAKIIALLEELRRDLPNVQDRADPDADEMARSADPEAVFEALKETQAAPPAEPTPDDGSSTGSGPA